MCVGWELYLDLQGVREVSGILGMVYIFTYFGYDSITAFVCKMSWSFKPKICARKNVLSLQKEL